MRSAIFLAHVSETLRLPRKGAQSLAPATQNDIWKSKSGANM